LKITNPNLIGGKKKMDKITELQEQMNKISFLLFNDIGILQRDAPNLEEYLKTDEKKYQEEKEKLQTLSKQMGKTLISEFKLFDQLIDELPDLDKTEKQQIEEIKKLNEENEKYSEILKNKAKEAENIVDNSNIALKEILNDKIKN
jgi:hypothetical protein